MLLAKKVSLSIAIISFLTACAHIPIEDKTSLRKVYHPSEVVDFPETGVITTVDVGNTLVFKARRKSIPTLQVEKAFQSALGNAGAFEVPAGLFLEHLKNDTGTFYISETSGIQGSAKSFNDWFYGIYVPTTSNDVTEMCIYQAKNSTPSCWKDQNVIFKKVTSEFLSDSDFKRELVYIGKSGSVVSFVYREYFKDILRPAFSQEFKYDLNEGSVIGYKGARFEIIEAGNQGIKYKVITPLD